MEKSIIHFENGLSCVWKRKHYNSDYSTSTLFRQQNYRASELVPVTIAFMSKMQSLPKFSNIIDGDEMVLAMALHCGASNMVLKDLDRSLNALDVPNVQSVAIIPQVAQTDITPIVSQVPQVAQVPQVPKPLTLINGVDDVTTNATIDFIKANYPKYTDDVRKVLTTYGWTKITSDALVKLVYKKAFE